MTSTALIRNRLPDAQPAQPDNPGLPCLIGLDRDQLANYLRTLDTVPERQINMRVNQLWRWLYIHGKDNFSSMTDISDGLREQLAATASIARPEVATLQVSRDGTRKWLLRFPANGKSDRPVEIETVYIPSEDRGTLCISSQVGCTLNCTFCHTGTQRLVRNLTPDEIIAQILVARDALDDLSSQQRDTHNPGPVHDHAYPATGRRISNIVLMGMGEPLYNFDNVARAVRIALDQDGMNFSRRRVTLSTAGVVPMIARAGHEMGVMLAISLHAVHDDIRNELVPLNRKYPIAQLLEACRSYPGLSNAKRITFEYVMLKGINDSLGDARELVRLLAGIPAKINLIPFNPWPGSAHVCSDWETIEAFAEVVNRAGYASPIRMPRGRDIFAACGQLKSASQRHRHKPAKQSKPGPGKPQIL